MKLLVKVILFAFFLCEKGSILNALPSQIIVVPSAEQSSGSLTLKGSQRAMALAPKLMSDFSISILFASKPTYANTSLASLQTITPLSSQTAQTIHLPFGVSEESSLSRLLLTNPSYNGRSILVAWDQSALSLLFSSLGYTYEDIANPSAYVYLLPFPLSILQRYPQELLFDDPSNPTNQ